MPIKSSDNDSLSAFSQFCLANNLLKKQENYYFDDSSLKSEVSFPSSHFELDGADGQHETFWSRIRAEWVMRHISRIKIDNLFEVGAGHGNMLRYLQAQGVVVAALEPIEVGADKLCKLGIPTIHAQISQSTKGAELFDCIGAFDVIEHIREDRAFLQVLVRLLKPGGYLFISVPAHPFLFSEYDYELGHFRRYTKRSLLDLTESLGLKTIELSPLFGFLLPAVYSRKFPALGTEKITLNSLSKIWGKLDNILAGLSRLELSLRVPWGTSLIGIFRK